MENQQSKPSSAYIFDLITRAQNGDQAAFDELYQQYFAPIYRYIFFRVKSNADAEDLTQTVFLKAWRGLVKFQERGRPFSAWLYQIARHALIDYYRKHKNTQLTQPLENYQWLADEQTAFLPDVRADQVRLSEELRQLIQTLSPSQREVVTLKFVDGFSTQEIASLLNKRPIAVRALQYRALKALRLKLKKLSSMGG